MCCCHCSLCWLVVGGVAVVVTSLPSSVSLYVVYWLLVLLLLSHPSLVSVCRDRCGPYCLGVGGAAVVVTSFISLCVLRSLWPVLVGCRWCCCCCHILHQSLCAVVIVACIVWVLVVLLLLSHPSPVSVCRCHCGLYCLGVGGAAVVVTSFTSLCVPLSLWPVLSGCWWCCCCCHILHQSLCCGSWPLCWVAGGVAAVLKRKVVCFSVVCGDGIIHVKTLSIFEEVSFDDCRVGSLSIRVTPSKTSR